MNECVVVVREGNGRKRLKGERERDVCGCKSELQETDQQGPQNPVRGCTKRPRGQDANTGAAQSTRNQPNPRHGMEGRGWFVTVHIHAFYLHPLTCVPTGGKPLVTSPWVGVTRTSCSGRLADMVGYPGHNGRRLPPSLPCLPHVSLPPDARHSQGLG